MMAETCLYHSLLLLFVSPTMWKSEILGGGIFGSQTHHAIVLSLIFVYLINFLLELIYVIKMSIHKHICFFPLGFD